MQAVGDTLLVHWQPVASAEPPRTLELPVPEYIAEMPSAPVWTVVLQQGRLMTAISGA